MPTLLEAAGCESVTGLAGHPLQPLFSGEEAQWRKCLFTEYHTHAAAANYHRERAVRTDRYKLIENLLPDTVNPDYVDTIRKLEGVAVDRGQEDFSENDAAKTPHADLEHVGLCSVHLRPGNHFNFGGNL